MHGERGRSEQLRWKTNYSIDLILFEFTGHIRLLFVIKWTYKIHHVAQTYFKDQWTVLIGPGREREIDMQTNIFSKRRLIFDFPSVPSLNFKCSLHTWKKNNKKSNQKENTLVRVSWSPRERMRCRKGSPMNTDTLILEEKESKHIKRTREDSRYCCPKSWTLKSHLYM